MPINYQEIYTQVKEIGKGAKERRKKKEEAQVSARNLLSVYGSQLDFLRSKVDSAKQADSNIRCAYSLNESLASRFSYPYLTLRVLFNQPRSQLTVRRSTRIVTRRFSFASSTSARYR